MQDEDFLFACARRAAVLFLDCWNSTSKVGAAAPLNALGQMLITNVVHNGLCGSSKVAKAGKGRDGMVSE